MFLVGGRGRFVGQRCQAFGREMRSGKSRTVGSGDAVSVHESVCRLERPSKRTDEIDHWRNRHAEVRGVSADQNTTLAWIPPPRPVVPVEPVRPVVELLLVLLVVLLVELLVVLRGATGATSSRAAPSRVASGSTRCARSRRNFARALNSCDFDPPAVMPSVLAISSCVYPSTSCRTNTARAPGASLAVAASIDALRNGRSSSGGVEAVDSSIPVSSACMRLVRRSALSVRLTAIRWAHVPNCESPRKPGKARKIWIQTSCATSAA